MADRVLFWDFHGTLVYPDTLWSINIYRAMKEVLADTKITLDDIRLNLDADGFPWQRPDLDYTDITDPDKWWEYLGEAFYRTFSSCGISRIDAEDIVPLIRGKILKLKNYRLYPDTEEVLKELQENGFLNIVLSNNFPELDQVIQGLGLSEYITEVISSAAVGYEKPRAEIFEYALEKYSYPRLCFVIGDNEKSDVAGGKNAGLKTILLSKSKNSEADYICKNLTEVKQLLLSFE